MEYYYTFSFVQCVFGCPKRPFDGQGDVGVFSRLDATRLENHQPRPFSSSLSSPPSLSSSSFGWHIHFVCGGVVAGGCCWLSLAASAADWPFVRSCVCRFIRSVVLCSSSFLVANNVTHLSQRASLSVLAFVGDGTFRSTHCVLVGTQPTCTINQPTHFEPGCVVCKLVVRCSWCFRNHWGTYGEWTVWSQRV